MDCKSGRKSCLKRVNLEASGTTSNPQKSRSSWEYFRNTISREIVGIEDNLQFLPELIERFMQPAPMHKRTDEKRIRNLLMIRYVRCRENTINAV